MCVSTSCDQCEEKAYEMILGDARKVFDLSQENDELRDRYGRNTFGQSCLMARRLVEQGVPYVTINYKGWDTHKQHFQIMNRKLPELDAGIRHAAAGSIRARPARHHDRLVGRRVRPHARRSSGRLRGTADAGISETASRPVLAGGGFKGGHVVGPSDSTGSEVAERPVHPTRFVRKHLRTPRHRSRRPAAEPAGAGPEGDADHMPGTGKDFGRLREIM